MRRKSAALLLSLGLGAVAVRGPASQEIQEPVDESFGEEVLVTEVLLDVLVTDRDDRLILGLGAEDFVVTEKGEEIEVTSVSFYSSKRLLESSELLTERGVEVDVVPQDRFFVLFLQEQRHQSIARPSPIRRQMDAGREISRWLVETAQPADRVAVVSFRGRLKVHQDFTTDRTALVAAVEGAVRGRDPEKIPPSRRSTVEPDPAALSALPSGRELTRSTSSVYSALRLVARALREVPGRKNLIFVGSGFGNVGSYGLYEAEFGKLRPTLEALNDANVAVYSLDLTAPGVQQSLQPSLRDLAAATGGRVYFNQWSFTGALTEISDLTSGYYLLSYQSRRPVGDAGYQRVRVGTRNRDFRIQARQGYRFGAGDP